MIRGHIVAAVIPCYRVRDSILKVLAAMPSEVDRIYCVDDKCPEKSGEFITASCTDGRVKVVMHEVNRGVGGAVKSGYEAALADGADILVKVDGDGQMDPRLLPGFCHPIARGLADYTKGNRFHHPEDVSGMPLVRLIGNAGLSFITKISSGYYGIVDPTNGYTAVHRSALATLRLDKIADRYFFESDMLFRLGIARAVIVDVPMRAVYGEEKSSLRVGKALGEFAWRNLINSVKRLAYIYFLREFNIGTVQGVAGGLALLFGLVFGVVNWVHFSRLGVGAPIGTIMIASLAITLGFQALISFIQYDVSNAPRIPLQAILDDRPDGDKRSITARLERAQGVPAEAGARSPQGA